MAKTLPPLTRQPVVQLTPPPMHRAAAGAVRQPLPPLRLADSVNPEKISATGKQKAIYMAIHATRTLLAAVVISAILAAVQGGALQLTTNLALVALAVAVVKAVLEGFFTPALNELGPNLSQPKAKGNKLYSTKEFVVKFGGGLAESLTYMLGVYTLSIAGRIITENSLKEGDSPELAKVLAQFYQIRWALQATTLAFEFSGKMVTAGIGCLGHSEYKWHDKNTQFAAMGKHFDFRHMPKQALQSISATVVREGFAGLGTGWLYIAGPATKSAQVEFASLLNGVLNGVAKLTQNMLSDLMYNSIAPHKKKNADQAGAIEFNDPFVTDGLELGRRDAIVPMEDGELFPEDVAVRGRILDEVDEHDEPGDPIQPPPPALVKTGSRAESAHRLTNLPTLERAGDAGQSQTILDAMANLRRLSLTALSESAAEKQARTAVAATSRPNNALASGSANPAVQEETPEAPVQSRFESLPDFGLDTTQADFAIETLFPTEVRQPAPPNLRKDQHPTELSVLTASAGDESLSEPLKKTPAGPEIAPAATPDRSRTPLRTSIRSGSVATSAVSNATSYKAGQKPIALTLQPGSASTDRQASAAKTARRVRPSSGTGMPVMGADGKILHRRADRKPLFSPVSGYSPSLSPTQLSEDGESVRSLETALHQRLPQPPAAALTPAIPEFSEDVGTAPALPIASLPYGEENSLAGFLAADARARRAESGSGTTTAEKMPVKDLQDESLTTP